MWLSFVVLYNIVVFPYFSVSSIGSGGIQAWSRRPTGFLQCFDTVDLVIWPVKNGPKMTYNVLSGISSLYTFTVTVFLKFISCLVQISKWERNIWFLSVVILLCFCCLVVLMLFKCQSRNGFSNDSTLALFLSRCISLQSRMVQWKPCQGTFIYLFYFILFIN